jgi:hypothetical protein
MIRYCLVVTLVLLVGSVILLNTACHKRVTSSNGWSNVLSVDVQGDNSFYTDAWVMVGNAEGTAIKDVRRLNQAGLLDLGDYGPERISVYFVYTTPNGISYVDCFLNTLGGPWTFVRGLPPVLGQARITFHFTPRTYNSYSIVTPCDWDSHGQELIRDSVMTKTLDIHGLEPDDKLSIYSSFWNYNDDSQISGWILDQPFVRGQINEYNVRLNQPLAQRTVSFSQPVSHLWVDSYRGANCSKFNLVSDQCVGMNFLEVTFSCPAFPVNMLHLFTARVEDNVTRIFEYTGEVLPASYAPPQSFIEANFESQPYQITDIHVTGNADAVVGNFTFMDTDTLHLCHWSVYAPPWTNTIKLPTIPDSILAMIHSNVSLLNAVGYRMDDYDTVFGWDGYVNLMSNADLLRRTPYVPRFSRDAAECSYTSVTRVCHNYDNGEWKTGKAR